MPRKLLLFNLKGILPSDQVGDQLDRGNDEVRILYFLERLEREAEKAGGKLHILNGNHETMNVAGRFNYATLPGLADFYQWQLMQSWGSSLKVWPLSLNSPQLLRQQCMNFFKPTLIV